MTDANINISKFEPKTNTTYIHNADGIRSKRINDKYDLRDSINTIGDSTSYGLNINYEDKDIKVIIKGGSGI